MELCETIGKRVVLENPEEFFYFIKKSPKFVSWKNLEIIAGCGNTSLKAYKIGERTLPGKAFIKMFDYLPEEQKEKTLGKICVLPKNWGCGKGGRQSIKKMKENLGNEGFLNYLAKIRSCSENAGFLGWHRRMKNENPLLYSRMQSQRAINRLRLWREKDRNRKKAVRSITAKYGSGFFTSLGLKTAENQKPTAREQIVKGNIDKLGFDIQVHKTICGFNFDFAYYKEGVLKAVEEVLGFRKKKGSLYFDILVLYEKYKTIKQKYDTPFFVTTWKEVKIKRKTERLPMELLIWATEKGMISILADTVFFNEVRKEALYEKPFLKSEAIEFIKKDLRDRKEMLEKGAKIQSMQSFDELEQQVHEKLKAMNLSPQGKKMLQTNHSTFVVPDNYFCNNGESFAVFASKNDINGVIGSAAIVKELVSPKVKTVGIVLFTGRKKHSMRLQNTLLKTYVDYFYTCLEDLEQLKGS